MMYAVRGCTKAHVAGVHTTTISSVGSKGMPTLQVAVNVRDETAVGEHPGVHIRLVNGLGDGLLFCVPIQDTGPPPSPACRFHPEYLGTTCFPSPPWRRNMICIFASGMSVLDAPLSEKFRCTVRCRWLPWTVSLRIFTGGHSSSRPETNLARDEVLGDYHASCNLLVRDPLFISIEAGFCQVSGRQAQMHGARHGKKGAGDERCPVSEVQSPRQKKGHPWHRGIPSMELDIGPTEKGTYVQYVGISTYLQAPCRNAFCAVGLSLSCLATAAVKYARLPLLFDRRVTENGKDSYSELRLRHCAPHDETCHRVQISSANKVLEKERRRNLVSPRRHTQTSFGSCLYVGLLVRGGFVRLLCNQRILIAVLRSVLSNSFVGYLPFKA
ncbi:hypothetical protein GE21DRAFT_1313299 [Neurospora crassa]|nr:hypothetical protein GE21DRAFT_1313299 [Neurospora crassa]